MTGFGVRSTGGRSGRQCKLKWDWVPVLLPHTLPSHTSPWDSGDPCRTHVPGSLGSPFLFSLKVLVPPKVSNSPIPTSGGTEWIVRKQPQPVRVQKESRPVVLRVVFLEVWQSVVAVWFVFYVTGDLRRHRCEGILPKYDNPVKKSKKGSNTEGGRGSPWEG